MRVRRNFLSLLVSLTLIYLCKEQYGRFVMTLAYSMEIVRYRVTGLPRHFVPRNDLGSSVVNKGPGC